MVQTLSLRVLPDRKLALSAHSQCQPPAPLPARGTPAWATPRRRSSPDRADNPLCVAALPYPQANSRASPQAMHRPRSAPPVAMNEYPVLECRSAALNVRYWVFQDATLAVPIVCLASPAIKTYRGILPPSAVL